MSEIIDAKVTNLKPFLLVVTLSIVLNTVLTSVLAISLITSVTTLNQFVTDYRVYRQGVQKMEATSKGLADLIAQFHQEDLQKLHEAKQSGNTKDAPVEEETEED